MFFFENYFDSFLISFFIINLLISVLRGFITDFISFAIFIIATFITYKGSSFIAKMFLNNFQNKLLLDSVVAIATFAIVTITLKLLTYTLVFNLKKNVNPLLDKSLACLFGFLKSMIIFGLIFLIVENFYQNFVDFKNINIAKDQTKNQESLFKIVSKNSKFSYLARISINAAKPFYSLISNSVDTKIDKDLGNIILEINKNKDYYSPDDTKEEKTKKDNKESKGLIEKETQSNQDGVDKKAKEDYKEIGYNKEEIKEIGDLIRVIKLENTR
jgi:uncharacterized membrane protein required for colicin V production